MKKNKKQHFLYIIAILLSIMLHLKTNTRITIIIGQCQVTVLHIITTCRFYFRVFSVQHLNIFHSPVSNRINRQDTRLPETLQHLFSHTLMRIPNTIESNEVSNEIL